MDLRYRTFRLAILLIVIGLVVGGSAGKSRSQAAELVRDEHQPVRYRRILVPAEAPAAWPVAAEKYLPIETREFDAWIADANQPAAAARIAAADYRARLEGSQLVDGRGSWTVELKNGKSAYLPLDKTSLLIAGARWRDESDTVRGPARIGLWPVAAGSSSYGLEVPQSGVLEFGWHTLRVLQRGNAVEIALRLPSAEMTRLTLDLPAGLRPVMEGCVVVESSPLKSADVATTGTITNDGAGGQGRLSPRSPAPDPPSQNLRRWVLAVGEFTSGHLRIESDAADARPRPSVPAAVSVHDELLYRITTQGLDLEATLRLDRMGHPLRELSVAMPTALQLVNATANGQNVRWRTAVNPQTDAVRAVIELPDVPLDDELVLILQAWGEPVLDAAWELPILRVEEAAWTSGTLRIAMDESLELGELQAIDCIQTDTQQVDTPRGQIETRSLRSFSPNAHVKLIVGRRAASGRVRSTTALEIGVPDLQALVVAQLNVDRGSFFAARAELQPGWLIDAVETMPADALGEWYVETHNGRRSLELQLGRAATAARPVTILVTAVRRRGQASSFEPLELRALATLHWQDLEVERKLLRLEAVEPYQLEPLGELQSVAYSDLTGDDTWQVPTPADGQWFDLQSAVADRSQRVRLVSARGTYDADIRLDAVVHGESLESTYRVSCRPRQSGVDELLVYFSEPLPTPPRWLNADTGEPLAAQRLPADDPRLRGVPPGGELWQLPLGRTYLSNVSLSATARTPVVKRRALPLVSLPDASLVEGRVAIGSIDRATPTIEIEGLTPVPVPTGADQIEWAAVYRYRPIHFYDAGTSQRLWLAPPAVTNTAAALLATSVRLESFYSATGRGDHRATYHLENRDAARVELTLPAGAEFHSASLDNLPLTPSTAESSPGALLLSLPRFWTGGVLTLNYQTKSNRLAGGAHVQPPLPAGDVSILSGAWIVWLPAEFTIAPAAAAGPDFDWRQRIFGPLARPADELPFNLLRAGDWLALWPGGESTSGADVSESPAVVRGLPDPARSRGPAERQAKTIGDAFVVPAAAADPTEPIKLAGFDATSRGASRAGDSSLVRAVLGPSVLAAPQGWHSFEFGFVARSPQPITLLDAPRSTAWSLAMFLACLCGLMLYPPRATQFVAMLTAAVVLSVLLPAAYAPLATGAVLGLTLAPVCRWIMRRSDPTAPQSGHTSQPGGSTTAAMQSALQLLSIISLAFALAGVSSAQTADGRGSPDPVRSRVTNDDARTTNHEQLAGPPDTRHSSIGDSPLTIHRVLVPVDDAGKPVGKTCFVNESFAEQLLRMTQEQVRERGSWLLVGMSVTARESAAAGGGDLSRRLPGPSARLGSWTLSLEIEVLARDASVELPLVKTEAEWPAAASLDGIPTAIDWNESGVGCRMQVREPGRYQLTLRFEPRTSIVAGRRQFKLSLPPLPGATLRLTASPTFVDPIVNGARLERLEDQAEAVWTAELDGSTVVRGSPTVVRGSPDPARSRGSAGSSATTLVLDWTDPSTDSAASAAPLLDELRWLRIEPNDTFLDVKYILGQRGVAGGEIRWPASLSLWVDHRCELVADVGQGPVSLVEQLPDGRQSITIRPEPDATGESLRDVYLRFRVRGAAPLGRFRVPAVESISQPVRKRWLAITADPAFDCAPVGDVAIAGATASDFAAAWGATHDDATPQLVLNGELPNNAWNLAVRPRRSQSEHVERLLVAAGRERFRLVYQADVAPHGADRFGWSLSVPAGLSIDSVTAEHADAPLLLHWIRTAPDRVNVFFAAKTDGPYRLMLTGAVPVSGCGEHQLPRLTAPDAEHALQTVSLYRDEDVIATVLSPTPAVIPETDLPHLPPGNWNTRFVGSFTVDSQAADSVRVLTEPNHVRLDGRTITTLQSDGGQWFATFAAQLRVEEGELDTLELRVPSAWAGPFEVDPAAVGATLSAGDGEFATMTVRFSNPVHQGDVVEFEIRSPLSVAAGQPTTVPQITPRLAGRWDRFVSVPTSVDAQSVTWSRTGVEPVVRPDGLPASDSATFQVVADPFRVALRSPEQRASLSVVRLAEMTVLVGPAGGQFMATRFTIVPQGLSECLLELPDGARLIRVALDGHPAITRPLEHHRLWVQLGPPNLPQTLDVVTRAAASTGAGLRRLRVRRPSLVQLDQTVPVEVSLWSLCRSATTAQERVAGAAPLTAGEQSAFRLERLVSISEAATRPVIDSPIADGYHWFVHWTQTLKTAERAARSQPIDPARLRQVPPEASADGDPRTLAIDRSAAWRKQAEELFATSGAAAASEQPTATKQNGGLKIATPPGCSWSHFVAAGTRGGDDLPAVAAGQDELRIEWVPEALTPLASRLVVLSCVIVLAAAAGWLVNRPATRDVLVRWPFATAALSGLAAWAWLRPSWLGLAIAVVSLGLWLKDTLSGRSEN